MKKILLISPHFDDAVLSAGQYMADRPDAEVVTVYGGFPVNAEHLTTAYDVKCGFKNAEDAVAQRQRENDQALALLEATAINLDFVDSQYESQHQPAPHLSEMIEKLQEIVNGYNYEFIMAPLGMGHPDHVKVTDAVIRLQTDIPIYLWEDLPIRVVEPTLVPPRLELLSLTLDKLMTPSTTGDKMAKKIRSMLCYRSQVHIGIIDPYLIYVPERFWRFK